MPLRSNLFCGDAALEAAATSNPKHIMRGAQGPHVAKIQVALGILDGASIDDAELAAKTYGAATAAAVLAYKRARDIVNHAYQSQADDIVGIMTMEQLDKELVENEREPERSARSQCGRPCLCASSFTREKLHRRMTIICQVAARQAIA